MHFNFKAALASGADLEVAGAVREAAGSEAFVWADANQGYNLHQAREAAPRLAAAGVNVLEQPLPADRMHLMRELRKSVRIPLAVDESSVSPADFFAYAAEGLVDYLVVKVTRSGGVWPTLAQISVAEAAGLPLLVSGLTDGLLTKLAVCQVAAAFGCAGPAALNGSQFTDESALFPNKADVESGGTVHLPAEPGIGVRPDEEALLDLVANEERAVMRLVHEVGEAVELRNGRDLLFRYVYESGVDPAESPKPYFHPSAHPGRRGANALQAPRSPLAHRPGDDLGLPLEGELLGWSDLRAGRGIRLARKPGEDQAPGLEEIQGDGASIKELLTWISHEEETWIEEERGISVGEIDPAGGFWSLDLSFRLKNVGTDP